LAQAVLAQERSPKRGALVLPAVSQLLL